MSTDTKIFYEMYKEIIYLNENLISISEELGEIRHEIETFPVGFRIDNIGDALPDKMQIDGLDRIIKLLEPMEKKTTSKRTE